MNVTVMYNKISNQMEYNARAFLKTTWCMYKANSLQKKCPNDFMLNSTSTVL